MNKTLYRVLLASALMACTSLVSASEQAGVSPRDMTWMKKQQQAMDAFKQNLQGQTLSLPPEQQALINRMQGDVARQQGERPGGEKKCSLPSTLSAWGFPGKVCYRCYGTQTVTVFPLRSVDW